jgi:hypothetical protein
LSFLSFLGSPGPFILLLNAGSPRSAPGRLLPPLLLYRTQISPGQDWIDPLHRTFSTGSIYEWCTAGVRCSSMVDCQSSSHRGYSSFTAAVPLPGWHGTPESRRGPGAGPQACQLSALACFDVRKTSGGPSETTVCVCVCVCVCTTCHGY